MPDITTAAKIVSALAAIETDEKCPHCGHGFAADQVAMSYRDPDDGKCYHDSCLLEIYLVEAYPLDTDIDDMMNAIVENGPPVIGTDDSAMQILTERGL